MRNTTTRLVPLTLILLGTLSFMGCSDDSGSADGGGPTVDLEVYPDMGKLWPCDEAGKPCNAHDSCAVDPVCGKDLLCRPRTFQVCDDGLACTEDVCKGLGLCEHVPKQGWCALAVVEPVGGADAGVDSGATQTTIKCFKAGEADPSDACALCDPDKDPNKWTAANGGYCDDGDPCTKDDYCQNGECKGVNYSSQCADEYGCTKDLCDGKGGCLGNELRSDWCLINGECVKDQGLDPSGACNICDVAASQSAWTPITDTCTIDSKCYNAGATHSSGACAECDPKTSTSAWTPTGVDCFIGGSCVKEGTKDSTGCSTCDPKSSTTDWTPLAGLCLIDGTCYQPNDLSPDKCGECDPTKSATSWSPVALKCLIDGTCHDDGDVHPEGCAKCDSAADGTAWTVTDTTKCVVAGSCVDKATSAYACGACGVACGAGEICSGGKCTCGTLEGTVGGGQVCPADQSCDQTTGSCVNLPPGVLGAPITLDFESSDSGLSGTKDWEWGKIGTFASGSANCGTYANEPPSQGHSGTGVWATKVNDCYSPLGNNSSTCSNSDPSDDSVLSFKVKIPANWTSATLSWWEWYDVNLTFDWSEVRVEGAVVLQTCSGSKPNPVVWTQKSVDLSAHAGKIISVAFHFLASSVVQYSGWYIDDLEISGS